MLYNYFESKGSDVSTGPELADYIPRQANHVFDRMLSDQLKLSENGFLWEINAVLDP